MAFTVTFTVTRMVAVDTHVNGRNESKVSVRILNGYSRDHVHFFPKDWPSKEMMASFFAIDRVDKTYRVEAEEYAYTRTDGTRGRGLRIIRFVK